MTDALCETPTQLNVDSPCIHCGYNLRGLQPDGICPECGQEIAASLQGDLLFFAEPVWLRRVVLGVWLKLLSLVGVVFFILILSVSVAAGLRGSLIMMAGVIISPLLSLWAVFCITVPEPRLSLGEDRVVFRSVIRICAGFGVARTLFQNVGWIPLPQTARVGIGAVGAFAAAVVVFGLLFYLRGFARRIPDQKLEKSATALLWVLPCAMIMRLVLKVFFGVSLSAAKATASSSFVTYVATATSIAFAVALLYYAMVLWRFNTALSAVLAIAEANASGDQPGGPAALPG